MKRKKKEEVQMGHLISKIIKKRKYIYVPFNHKERKKNLNSFICFYFIMIIFFIYFFTLKPKCKRKRKVSKENDFSLKI